MWRPLPHTIDPQFSSPFSASFEAPYFFITTHPASFPILLQKQRTLFPRSKCPVPFPFPAAAAAPSFPYDIFPVPFPIPATEAAAAAATSPWARKPSGSGGLMSCGHACYKTGGHRFKPTTRGLTRHEAYRQRCKPTTLGLATSCKACGQRGTLAWALGIARTAGKAWSEWRLVILWRCDVYVHFGVFDLTWRAG